MAKAQKGDLIRVVNILSSVHIDSIKLGGIYEVISLVDAGVVVNAGDRNYTVFTDEYEIHRKAGEEDAPKGLYIDYLKKQSDPQDAVHHPNHYTQGRFEVIDVIEDAVVGADPFEAVCQANILKYTLRYRHKNGVEDLKKARWYLEKLISVKEVSTNVK